jgi:primosomal protein N' (replication factor Y)
MRCLWRPPARLRFCRSAPVIYVDVSLPIPLDQPFTYGLPVTLEHRVQPGCRVLVPFAGRKLTGVVLKVHDAPPKGSLKDVLRLLDEAPVLDAELIALGQWIASYYCAPLGEVLRSMTPLTGEVRRSKLYSLTDAGRDAARQLLLGPASEDPVLQVLALLEARPASAEYLKKKVPGAANVIRSLEKRAFIVVEDLEADRDPLRASAARLRVEFVTRSEGKLPKAERELLSYLELHPGSHNVQQLEAIVKGASPAARALARRSSVKLETESLVTWREPIRPERTLNPHQLGAYEQIEAALRGDQFKAFLLQGVTGSGKTEVYLRAIDAAWRWGAARCCWSRRSD